MSTTHETEAPAKGWDVYMNDVHVGTLSDEQYQSMRQTVRKDVRIAGQQVLLLGAGTFRIFTAAVDFLLIGIPVIMFWLAVLIGIFFPQSYTEVLQALKAEDPKTIATLILRVAVSIAIPLLLLKALFVVHRLGRAQTAYALAFADQVRKHFKLTATGQLEVHRQL